MAVHDQPFRLLELPPELRVRIYECFFELRTSLEAISIFEAQQQAPSLAIGATSRLIRREALALGMDAVRQFYRQQKFFLEFPLCLSWYWSHALSAVEVAAMALAPMPITTLEVRYSIEMTTGETTYTESTMSVSAGDDVEELRRYRFHDEEDYGPSRHAHNTPLRALAQELGFALKWGSSLQYLHVGNIARAVLYNICDE
ncbi:hypothetical protein LTR15_000033 [Elasticomyces elasticus]|nr:hypothetical protein LTR15_000033 [Elasticomyces elasticus]